MPLLFSYGSNNPKQLADRLGHSFNSEAAYLPGYQRVFRGFSQRWGGGTASMQKASGGAVFGYVAQVSAADLAQLDRFEGVGLGIYRRSKVKPIVDGSRVDAIAYIHTSREFNRPTDAYLDAVAKTIGSFWRGEHGAVGRSDIIVRDNPIGSSIGRFVDQHPFVALLGGIALLSAIPITIVAMKKASA
jgi:hypothetical protein